MITEWKRYSNQRMLRSPSTGQAEGVPAIELFFKDLAAELFQNARASSSVAYSGSK